VRSGVVQTRVKNQQIATAIVLPLAVHVVNVDVIGKANTRTPRDAGNHTVLKSETSVALFIVDVAFRV
jgi:hypothetical protein